MQPRAAFCECTYGSNANCTGVCLSNDSGFEVLTIVLYRCCVYKDATCAFLSDVCVLGV